MELTPPQRKFLGEAAANYLGVAKLFETNGLARRNRRQMAERLCDAGLMRPYTHGLNEFEITDKGRATLGEGR